MTDTPVDLAAAAQEFLDAADALDRVNRNAATLRASAAQLEDARVSLANAEQSVTSSGASLGEAAATLATTGRQLATVAARLAELDPVVLVTKLDAQSKRLTVLSWLAAVSVGLTGLLTVIVLSR